MRQAPLDADGASRTGDAGDLRSVCSPHQAPWGYSESRSHGSTSVLTGKYNGSFAKLKVQLSHLIHFHCVCHKGQLAASNIFEAVPFCTTRPRTNACLCMATPEDKP